jgi:hypothetical protein
MSLASKAAMSGGASAAPAPAAVTQAESAGKWASVFGGKSSKAVNSAASEGGTSGGGGLSSAFGGSTSGGGPMLRPAPGSKTGTYVAPSRSSSNGFGASDDPRFAGKFGSQRPGMGSLPTGPGGARGGVVNNAPLPTVGPSQDELAKQKKLKEDEKAAKKAVRDAEEKKKLEEKKALIAEKEAQAEAIKQKKIQNLEYAKVAFDSGKKGIELTEYINNMSNKPTCESLLIHILNTLAKEDIEKLKWSMPTEYGNALSTLKVTVNDQLYACYACQSYCYKNLFPKIGINSTPLLKLMFSVLYKYEIVDEEGFLKWQNDDDNDDNNDYNNGRVNATVQTTSFFQLLFEPEEEEYDSNDEEDEEDEIDAPRETC